VNSLSKGVTRKIYDFSWEYCFIVGFISSQNSHSQVSFTTPCGTRLSLVRFEFYCLPDSKGAFLRMTELLSER